MDLKAIAHDTVAALEKGEYTAPDGTVVPIAALLAVCLNGTREYLPEELAALDAQVVQTGNQPLATTLTVASETTLQGCARLLASNHYQRVGVLNFASAKHPGGGFLNGASAQEESIARSSGLYSSLLRCPRILRLS